MQATHSLAATAALGATVGAALLAGCAQTGATPAGVRAGEQPVELGLVRWERDFKLATARARDERRDVLLVFQEVPG